MIVNNIISINFFKLKIGSNNSKIYILLESSYVMYRRFKKKGERSRTGVSVLINSDEAKSIHENFSTNDVYLRSIINKYIPKNTLKKPIDVMTYNELRYIGHIIYSAAEKEVKRSKIIERRRNSVTLAKKVVEKEPDYNQNKMEQLFLFR